MRHIEIDEDVYAWLEARVRGFETPNDVFRREVLGLDTAPATTPADPIPRIRQGALYGLIHAGLVEAGDELTCHRTRSGETYRATITEDGAIKTDLGVFTKPSPALKAFVGSEIDGWANWMHVPTRERLRDLRAQAVSLGLIGK
ncbi:hypothetical protein GCM10022197_17650 [Microlunatus spumicola]|uniref:RAMA domain-containing protein n=1 Tax=Microlunatus spumicola TaxID=81499 RepID=A0ABP6X9F1_9ACTN